LVTARQVARGVGRTMRAMERDAQRVQRQYIAYEKAAAKQAILDASADAAEGYESAIAMLTRSHRTSFERYNWSAIGLAEMPVDALRDDARELAAKAALASYRPGWFAETFGFAARRRKKLARAIAHARCEDENAYDDAKAEVERRRKEIAFAQRVLAGERPAIMEALEAHADFSGSAVEALHVLFSDKRVIAMVDGVEIDDLPTSSVTLLQSGKASIKPLATSKLQELHRDGICSSAVRVAAEFLKALPLDAVEVVVHSDLLDRGSGRIEPQPVFYGLITAQALGNVNLPLAEPAPLAERLGAHFDWHRRHGLQPIDLTPFNIPADVSIEEVA
jgi:hypothetical protein